MNTVSHDPNTQRCGGGLWEDGVGDAFSGKSLLFLENLCDVLFKSAVPEEQLNMC